MDLSDQEERLGKKGEGVSAGFEFCLPKCCSRFLYFEVFFAKVLQQVLILLKFFLRVLDHDKVKFYQRFKDLIVNKVLEQV